MKTKHSPRYAASQVLKLNATVAKLQNKLRDPIGRDWRKIADRNANIEARIAEAESKISKYAQSITLEAFYRYELDAEFCCDYTDFIGNN